MNSESLKTFVLLSETTSFTKTAGLLFVAQSTVTKRIADLEKELGKQLFKREKKSIELTDEGNIYLGYARRILKLEETSIMEINAYSVYEHNFRIGTTNTIYECHLVPYIKNTIEHKDNVAIKVKLGHSNELIQLLTDRMMDIVFTYVPFKKAGYFCKEFVEDRLVLVTGGDNELYPQGINKDELKKLNYLMCNFALQDIGMYIRELFPPYYNFRFEIDNSTKLIDYLISGFGYSFLPESMVISYINSGDLKIIQLSDFNPPMIKSYVAYKQNDEFASKFIKMMEKDV